MKRNKCVSVVSIILSAFLTLGGCEMNESASSVPESKAVGQESSLAENDFDIITEVSVNEPYEDPDKPAIMLDKSECAEGEAIKITYSNTDAKDWIGFYPEGADPGTINSIVWDYSVGNGTLSFNTSRVGAPGVYWVFLCDNDGYAVLDMKEITILDSDTNDYGAKSAVVNASVTNGYSEISVEVTPSSELELTYRFYWSKGEERLSGYEPIYTVTHSGGEKFVAKLNDCLFMPDGADGIEIAVSKGRSESVFASAPEELKAPESKF